IAMLWTAGRSWGAGPTTEPARAQVAQLLRVADENLDLGDTGEAIASLARALATVRQAALTSDPLAATVEGRLAAALALSGRASDAVAPFRAALKIKPDLTLEHRFERPIVKEAFEDARKAVLAATPPPPKAVPAPVASKPSPPAEPVDEGPVVGVRARTV